MRLIDADALRMFLEVVRQDCLEEDTFSSDFAAQVIETVQDEYIANAPTVYAVEVIRCKECKHWIHMEDGFGDCTNGRFHLDGCPDPTMKLDDFCSCGEKREEAKEDEKQKDAERAFSV